MQEICELIMLVCFGISWPISVCKSYKSRSAKGKSPIFITAIIVGYVSGIVGKFVGGQITYVLGLYCLNLLVVSADLTLYFLNKHRESADTDKREKRKGSECYEGSGFEKSECYKGI